MFTTILLSDRGETLEAAVDTREIMAIIEYRSGVLLPEVEEGEEPPQISCQVVKEDRGRLLVRVDEGLELLPPRSDVELEVPTEKALFRLLAAIERSVRTSDGTSIVYLLVDDIETIQRRKQERFTVNFPLKFIPIREGEKPSEARNRPAGLGRVTNISLGGLQFETDYELPVGLSAQFEVRLPNGHLDLNGKIVKAGKDSNGSNVYGVKLGRMDTVTSQRMNRLILQFERRARQARQNSRSRSTGASRRTIDRTRLRRTLMDRWQSRDTRRRRRR